MNTPVTVTFQHAGERQTQSLNAFVSMSEHHHRPVGEVFYHAGEMWRRGVGIFYKAHPCVRGIIYESLKRRWKKRSRSFFAGHFGPKRVSPSTSRWMRRREERRSVAEEGTPQ